MSNLKGENWDPNDAGLNKDPHPGNYSTGKEDQQNADPEQENEQEEKSESKEDKEAKNLHTEEPTNIDPLRSDPLHQFPK